MIDIAQDFFQKGGKFLYLDEVHKYKFWVRELKNIYDDFPELNIVFAASSILEILDSTADHSRRAVLFSVQGLSFREYIEFEKQIKLPIYSLEDLLQRHTQIAYELSAGF